MNCLEYNFFLGIKVLNKLKFSIIYMFCNIVIQFNSQDINKLNHRYSIVSDVGNLAEVREQIFCVFLLSTLICICVSVLTIGIK